MRSWVRERAGPNSAATASVEPATAICSRRAPETRDVRSGRCNQGQGKEKPAHPLVTEIGVVPQDLDPHGIVDGGRGIVVDLAGREGQPEHQDQEREAAQPHCRSPATGHQPSIGKEQEYEGDEAEPKHDYPLRRPRCPLAAGEKRRMREVGDRRPLDRRDKADGEENHPMALEGLRMAIRAPTPEYAITKTGSAVRSQNPSPAQRWRTPPGPLR
jgi:hypothetical protein